MTADRNLQRVPRAELRDGADHERLRHARVRDVGFPVGRYLQPAPMLFTRDGHNIFLGDMYRGRAAFLICSGPSLNTHDLSLLQQRGVLTLSLNNAATIFRTQLWCSVDDPGNFSDAIWRDPGIAKFVPLCHMEKTFTVRNEKHELVPSQERVGDMPSVFGFRRNEAFNAEQWLYEDTFNWGNHSRRVDAYGHKGSRSVMYVALRLLFYLGIRKIYLLGCDFRMAEGQKNYAFEQDRSASSVKGNNSSYQIMNVRFGHLKPYFERENFEVWNCTPNSGLTAFPSVRYEDALADILGTMPREILTKGMYERKAEEKHKPLEKAAQKPVAPAPLVPAVAIPSPRKAEGKPPRVAAPIAAKSQPLVLPVNVAPDTKAVATTRPVSPELTLLTWIDEASAPALKSAWSTWIAKRRELTDLPAVIVHDRRFEPRRSAVAFLHDLPQVRFVPWEVEGIRPDPLAAGRVWAASHSVRTPWYVQLAPNVLATETSQWMRADWFAANALGRKPALVGNPIVLSDYPKLLDRLNAWGDTVAELNSRPPIRSAVQSTSGTPLESSQLHWCYFGNTAWIQETAKYLTEAPPEVAGEVVLAYCALRRGEYTVGVRMEKFGWERVAGPLRHLRRRAANAV